MAWTRTQQAPVDPWEEQAFVDWLRQKQILPSTKDTYLKNYLQVRTWSLASPLQQLKAELLREGANMPTHQARPCPIQVLDDPALTTSPHRRAQFWLAWKTASRWSDLLRLTTADFIIPDDATLIVDWSNKTKASLRRPFRASRFTVVRPTHEVPDSVGPDASRPNTLAVDGGCIRSAEKSEPRPHGAQHQGGSYAGAGVGGSRGKNLQRVEVPTAQARSQGRRPGDVVAVRSRQSGAGVKPADAPRDLSTLNSFHRDIATILERWTKRGPPAKTSSNTSSLPLKSKRVGTIDVPALLSRITIPGDRARIIEAIAYVNSPTRYEEALAQYAQRKAVDPSLPDPPPRDRVSGFAGDDANQLLEHDIIEPIEIEHIKANGKVFTVDELHKDPPQ